MGIQSISRAELLAELFARIQAVARADPIPEHWFTQDEYAQSRGLTKDKARRQLYAAHQAGLLDRCQRGGHMWYYEKEK